MHFPVRIDPESGGTQQNANSHDPGNCGGKHTFAGEQIHLSLDGVIHGVVGPGTGNDGENGYDQIRNGRIFPQKKERPWQSAVPKKRWRLTLRISL